MPRRLRPLLLAVLLLTGCVHYKAQLYRATGPQSVQAGNRKVTVALITPARVTSRRNLPERVASLAYYRYIATGPYSLRVTVQTDGIEDGVPVEVTSAELRLASGETVEILSRQAPARQGITQQAPKNQSLPRDTFSRHDFVFPLAEKLVFKPDEPVRVVVTVRMDGKPEEVKLEAVFKGVFEEQWSTLMSQ